MDDREAVALHRPRLMKRLAQITTNNHRYKNNGDERKQPTHHITVDLHEVSPTLTH